MDNQIYVTFQHNGDEGTRDFTSEELGSKALFIEALCVAAQIEKPSDNMRALFGAVYDYTGQNAGGFPGIMCWGVMLQSPEWSLDMTIDPDTEAVTVKVSRESQGALGITPEGHDVVFAVGIGGGLQELYPDVFKERKAQLQLVSMEEIHARISIGADTKPKITFDPTRSRLFINKHIVVKMHALIQKTACVQYGVISDIDWMHVIRLGTWCRHTKKLCCTNLWENLLRREQNTKKQLQQQAFWCRQSISETKALPGLSGAIATDWTRANLKIRIKSASSDVSAAQPVQEKVVQHNPRPWLQYIMGWMLTLLACSITGVLLPFWSLAVAYMGVIGVAAVIAGCALLQLVGLVCFFHESKATKTSRMDSPLASASEAGQSAGFVESGVPAVVTHLVSDVLTPAVETAANEVPFVKTQQSDSAASLQV